MIKIRKGIDTIIVSTGAFKNFFEREGWVVEIDESPPSPAAPQEPKPLAKMPIDELQEKAAGLGFEVEGLDKKQLIEILKAQG